MTEQHRQISMEDYLRQAQRLDGVSPFVAKRVEAKREAINTIVRIVASDYGLTPEDILGLSRRADIAEARHVATHFLVINTDLSFRGVALGLGRTDHTTVLNSLNRIQERMTADPDFRERIESHPLSVRAA